MVISSSHSAPPPSFMMLIGLFIDSGNQVASEDKLFTENMDW